MRYIAFPTVHNGNWCKQFSIYYYFICIFLLLLHLLSTSVVVVIPLLLFSLLLSIHFILRLLLLRICLNNGKCLQSPFPFVYNFYLFHWQRCFHSLLLVLLPIPFDIKMSSKIKEEKNKTKPNNNFVIVPRHLKNPSASSVPLTFVFHLLVCPQQHAQSKTFTYIIVYKYIHLHYYSVLKCDASSVFKKVKTRK